MRRRDAIGLATVAAVWAATALYRAFFIEPRAWSALCAAAAPPLACVPRAGLLWLQQQYLLGAGALVLGLWAFFGGGFRVCVAGVALGIVGVENYNATWAMTGAALAAWCWIEAAVPQPRPAGVRG